MDKMREEFRKHCQIWRYSEEVDENDFFVNATTQRAWDVWVTAWQACRQALVVELPPIQMPTNDSDFSEGCHTGRLTYQDAVIDVLQEIGIKWKL